MMQLTLLLATFLAAGQVIEKPGEEQPQKKQQIVAAKLPVPDETARARAIGIIKQVFDKDYRDRKVENRRALVPKLLEQADDPANDAAMQYVLLTEAARIAAEAGDVQAALDSVANKASRFEEDPLQLKLNVLAVASTVRTSPEEQMRLVRNCTNLAEESASAERFDLAEKAATMAFNAAQKSMNKDVISQALQERQRIRIASSLYEAMCEAKSALLVNPHDPVAKLAFGRYLCFVKDRWDDGMPFLAAGDDAELKAAAEVDIAASRGFKEERVAGDAWFQLAKQEDGALEKQRLQVRAKHWYLLALPALAGMDRAGVDVRLAEIVEPKKVKLEVPTKTRKTATPMAPSSKRRPLRGNPVFFFSQETFINALKTGHGNWTIDRGRIAVYSWSYGLPGLLIFGPERDTGSLQATMKNGGYAASGCQGLAMCLTKEVNQDDGYHGSPAYFVRYKGATLELLDAIPYHKATKPPRQLASATAEVKGEAFYTIRISVQDGDKITVWLNGQKVLEHTAEQKLRGRFALLAANGSYVFQDVRLEVIGP